MHRQTTLRSYTCLSWSDLVCFWPLIGAGGWLDATLWCFIQKKSRKTRSSLEWFHHSHGITYRFKLVSLFQQKDPRLRHVVTIYFRGITFTGNGSIFTSHQKYRHSKWCVAKMQVGTSASSCAYEHASPLSQPESSVKSRIYWSWSLVGGFNPSEKY